MSQEGLILPTNLNPSGSLCVQLTIPDDPGYRYAVDGAILRIAQWQAWQRDPLKKGTIAAGHMRAAYIGMTIGACLTADIYRIDPDNGCIWQVSHDGGETWITFWNAATCEPDITHFLVDNPSLTTRQNIISPTGSGVAGIEIDTSTAHGLIIQSLWNSSAAWLRGQAATINNGVLHISVENDASAAFLYLSDPFGTSAPAINSHRMFLLPLQPAFTPSTDLNRGLYIDSTTRRPHLYTTIPATTTVIDKSLEYELTIAGEYVSQSADTLPTLSFAKTGDTWLGSMGLPPFIDPVNLTPAYHHLPDDTTPDLTITGTYPDLTITLELPTIPLPTVYNGDYTLQPAGTTPFIDMEVTIVDHSRSVVADLNLPPIDDPTSFNADVTVDPAYLSPSLAVVVSDVDHARSVDYILRTPPGQIDSAFPSSGTKIIRLLIDGAGSWLPVKVPNGYAVKVLTTYGLWSNHAVVGPLDRVTNGVHSYGTFPFFGDLVMLRTTGTPTIDGYYAELTTPIDPFSVFTAAEDLYLVFLQRFINEGDGANYPVGQIYADIELFSPGSEFDWTILAVPGDTGWTIYYTTQGGAVGSGCGGAGVYVVGAFTNLVYAADTIVAQVTINGTLVDPAGGGTSQLLYNLIAGDSQNFNYVATVGIIEHTFIPVGTPTVGTHAAAFQMSISTANYPTNVYSTCLNFWRMRGFGTAPHL